MCTHKRALAECAGKAISVMADWAKHLAGIKGVVLDISGVLYDSGGEGGGVPIPGSIDAVKKIKASGLKLRFCTNETQATRDKFVGKLQRLGFDIVVDEVTAPAPAACRILKERNLRPHLLVHDDVVPEFASIDKANPNCVVVGDAADNFSYKNLNDAFRVLIGLENPVLISLGRGRYYKETDGLKLDVGVYMKALEYACDIEAEVVGKPAKMFFQSALAEMGVQPHQAIMIGDDIVNDVGGAQQSGMRALQVRTGKYRWFTQRNNKHHMLMLCPQSGHGTCWDRPQQLRSREGLPSPVTGGWWTAVGRIYVVRLTV
ncbi:phospholysine phosphohistidine inorganic pyrophosphate phosphatase isoform X4 [Hemicordylus capensis]|uniref:phospholysine phosphohistidine inorganic pyrophosphate phosphatase isoform X4 n=1 Tax=Hemicordylus capensis TaxID=884348 RepID=UPI0023031B15|nr:phospholysine phosphohistidine inorganic pyrophosphate phosphatase isoform X4 [Hemicordylus capensis]